MEIRFLVRFHCFYVYICTLLFLAKGFNRIVCVLFQWLPLENVKSGKLHLRLVWLYLSKDPLVLNKVGYKYITQIAAHLIVVLE